MLHAERGTLVRAQRKSHSVWGTSRTKHKTPKIAYSSLVLWAQRGIEAHAQLKQLDDEHEVLREAATYWGELGHQLVSKTYILYIEILKK